jgi:outer membrane protein TolC
LGWINDRREPQPPFGPSRQEATQFSIGISKQFSTGTQLGFDLAHNVVSLEIPNFAAPQYAETRGTLKLSQSLLRNAFGESLRLSAEAAIEREKAAKEGFRESRESWFLQLAEQFYLAWNAQAQAEAAGGTVAQQQRLAAIVARKLKRGTAERPDLLQVESALSDARVREGEARQRLGDVWRQLVATLRLPATFADIDPREIPIDVGDADPTVTDRCEKPAPTDSISLRKAMAEAKAAELLSQRATSESRPELDLSVGAGANSIEAGSFDTFGDLARARFPFIQAGLTFKMPFGNDAARAAEVNARVARLRAEATASQERDLLAVHWKNRCLELERLAQAVVAHERAYRAQRERERLEEERFSVGRSQLIQVIQAADDAARAEVTYKATLAQHRFAAWNVRRLAGSLDGYLDTLEKEASQ